MCKKGSIKMRFKEIHYYGKNVNIYRVFLVEPKIKEDKIYTSILNKRDFTYALHYLMQSKKKYLHIHKLGEFQYER